MATILDSAILKSFSVNICVVYRKEAMSHNKVAGKLVVQLCTNNPILPNESIQWGVCIVCSNLKTAKAD